MKNKRIVVLASDCESSKWVYNALKKEFEILQVIIETPISKKMLFKNRVKKIGFLKVFGQALFSVIMVPILKLKSKERRLALIKEYNLDGSDFNKNEVYTVTSVNDDKCKAAIEKLQPDIILVNGTRIISKKILTCTNAIFVNMHVGITPFYRGSHGGYWAVKNNDILKFGTTIHLIDTGVDTGAIIKQAFILPTNDDNFVSYPILQIGVGIKALMELVPNIINETYKVHKSDQKGKMYYQPTIWQYFAN